MSTTGPNQRGSRTEVSCSNLSCRCSQGGICIAETIRSYETLIGQQTIPTALAVSVLDVKGPTDWGGDPEVTEHWCLAHYLLDGHHKTYAASDVQANITLVVPGGREGCFNPWFDSGSACTTGKRVKGHVANRIESEQPSEIALSPPARWGEHLWSGSRMIRVVLPFHLRTLAQVGPEVQIEVAGPVTQRSVLDALEASYPVLRGTMRRPRDAETPALHQVLRLRRRPFPRIPGRSPAGCCCYG